MIAGMKRLFGGKSAEKMIWLVLLAGMIADRIIILFHFAFRYVDHDQTLMWYSAVEMMHGRFHEPCFYGQNYNSMMEGLFAIPFLYLHLPFHIAFPILTSALAIFPYILFSFICLRQEKYFSACLILVVPILLPFQYDMLTSMPRGFVTGIFLGSIACIAMFFPTNKACWFFYGFFSGFSVWANPNTALLVLPVALFLFLTNLRKISFYAFIVAGFIPPLIWILYTNHFYATHPDYNFYKPVVISFSFPLLSESFNYLDLFFNYVSPIFWKSGWAVLIIIAVMIFVLLKQKKIIAGISLLSGLLIILLSFGLNKVHNGNNNVFFSYSRMYLAVPVLIALFSSQIRITLSRAWLLALLSLGFIVFFLKNYRLDAAIQKALNEFNDVVFIRENTLIEKSCHDLKDLALKNHVSLIISLNTLYDQMFACTCLEDSFPQTLLTHHERRTWRFEEEEHTVRSNILLIGNQLVDSAWYLVSHAPNIQRLHPGFNWLDDDVFPVYLITNNQLQTPELFKSLWVGTRYYEGTRHIQ